MVRLRVVLLAAYGALPAQRPLNVLVYGNSYCLDHDCTELLGALATETGQPVNVVPRLAGGTGLAYHRTNPAQVAAISTSLPSGQHWDCVVMQGLSTEATARLGNPEAFSADAVGIVGNVRAHSPGARAVLFQTWARARTDPFYPYHFSTPLAMHDEVRANYQRAADAIAATWGAGTAEVARVGDVLALLAFDPVFYHPDRSHPGESMTLVAAMAIYSAIWHRPVSDVAPDFAGQGPVARFFVTHGFKPESWAEMRGYADLVGGRELRRFPGSGDDLLLRSGPGTSLWARAHFEVNGGGSISLALTTPNGVYAAAPAALFADPHGTTQPFWPELFLSRNAVPLARVASLRDGIHLSLTMPSLPGTFLIQGVALAPSRATANPLFTTTDAHLLRVE